MDDSIRPYGSIWDIGADEFYPGPPTMNIRSIGTNTGILHSQGTANITSGTSVATLSGANLPLNVGEGDMLILNNTDTVYVLSRDNATQVTIQGTSANTHTNVSYQIRRAFDHPRDWSTSRGGDLVAENRVEKGLCYNDGVFGSTYAVNMENWVCDHYHYGWLTVRPEDRHTGLPGTGVKLTGTAILPGDHCIVEWLEYEGERIQPRGRYVTVRNCLLYGNTGGISLQYHNGNGAHYGRIYNNFIFGSQTGLVVYLPDSAIVANNTVYACNIGIELHAADYSNDIIYATNNISIGNQINWNFPGHNDGIYGDYNAGETGAMPIFGTHNLEVTPFETFTDTNRAAPDLHLKVTSPCYEGADETIAIGYFNNDIDDSSRVIPWEMGADEVVDDLLMNTPSVSPGPSQTV
jgi:hypothetical protein